MNITKKQRGNEITLRLEGRLDTAAAPDLEDELKLCIPKAESLVLDFGKLDYISSAGLRVLLSAHRSMAGKEGMRILHVSEDVKDVFDVTGFAGMLDIE